MYDAAMFCDLYDQDFGLLAKGMSDMLQKLTLSPVKDPWSVGEGFDYNHLAYYDNCFDEEIHQCRMLVTNPSDIHLFEVIEELPQEEKHFSHPEELKQQPTEVAVSRGISKTAEVGLPNGNLPEVPHKSTEPTTLAVDSLSSSSSEDDSDYEPSEPMVALGEKQKELISAILKECRRFHVRNLSIESLNSQLWWIASFWPV